MIYLDHHAGTPLASEACAAMDAARAHAWANPSSVHVAGRSARALLETARERVAAAIGGEPADVVFTSGGTEACNLGVLGLALDDAGGTRVRHVVTSEVEHPAVARVVERLEREGRVRVTRLATPRGLPPDAERVAEAVRDEGSLLAIQWVNHETGVRFPIEDYVRACRDAGTVSVFVDATQALGKLPVDVGSLGADTVAFASHKIGGPAGAGALWVRRSAEVVPIVAGGAQERGRRAGSPDLLACVGFGAACGCVAERLQAHVRLLGVRDRVARAIVALGGAINAEDAPRVATAVSASFVGRRGVELVAALDLEGVCVSSGAACSSGLSEPSAVLRAMYPDQPWRTLGALRWSFGPETTENAANTALVALGRILARGPS